MQQPELKSCPFCGSANIDASGWSSKTASGPACDDCGAAAGSTHDSHDDNITAWNTRAPIAEGGGDTVVARLSALWTLLNDAGDKYGACDTIHAAIESLSRQGGEAVAELIHSADALTRMVVLPEGMQLGYGTHKLYASPTRASEAGDWVLVPTECTHIMEYTLSEALDSGDYSIAECLNRAIAAAPAPGGAQ